MLTNPTIDMLRELGLSGMASAIHALEVQPDVRSLEHGEWLFLELPSQQSLRFGPLPARPTRGKHAAKRREEMEARLQRIAATLGTAYRDEFENGIEVWWTPPCLSTRRTSILFLSEFPAGAVDAATCRYRAALNSDTPDLSEPLGLPMSEAIAAHAAPAEIVEREKGRLRGKKLRARALQKLDTELAAIWLAADHPEKGCRRSCSLWHRTSGLRISLEQLEHRSVNKNRIPVTQEEFLIWMEKKFGLQGFRFTQRRNDGFPERRTPRQCCYDEVSLAKMQEMITLGV